MMKKLISFLLTLVLAFSLLTGCGTTAATPQAPAQEPADASKLQIVTTIFPIYDWVMNILGDQAANADVTMLLDNGVDLHSFQPTADDIVRIADCDLFIYVGGESDEWVEDALQEATNKDMVVIDLMEVLGDAVKEEEVVEGMEAEDEESEDGEEEVEYDEHVWLSLKNAAVLCKAFSLALGQIDGDNRSIYAANADAYIEKLNALDDQARAIVDGAKYDTLLFADRVPFRYRRWAEPRGLRRYGGGIGAAPDQRHAAGAVHHHPQRHRPAVYRPAR